MSKPAHERLPGEPEGYSPLKDVFCREYVIDNNATRAYLRIGRTQNYGSAEQLSRRMISDPWCQWKINSLRAERAERLRIDADWALQRLIELIEMDVADVVEQRDGEIYFKDLRKLPKSITTAISELGSKPSRYGTERKIKLPDKAPLIKMLMEHLQMFKPSEAENDNTGAEEFGQALDTDAEELWGDESSEDPGEPE